jgi:hypothetical protein
MSDNPRTIPTLRAKALRLLTIIRDRVPRRVHRVAVGPATGGRSGAEKEGPMSDPVFLSPRQVHAGAEALRKYRISLGNFAAAPTPWADLTADQKAPWVKNAAIVLTAARRAGEEPVHVRLELSPQAAEAVRRREKLRRWKQAADQPLAPWRGSAS